MCSSGTKKKKKASWAISPLFQCSNSTSSVIVPLMSEMFSAHKQTIKEVDKNIVITFKRTISYLPRKKSVSFYKEKIVFLKGFEPFAVPTIYYQTP